jgi:hypothetical protein
VDPQVGRGRQWREGGCFTAVGTVAAGTAPHKHAGLGAKRYGKKCLFLAVDSQVQRAVAHEFLAHMACCMAATPSVAARGCVLQVCICWHACWSAGFAVAAACCRFCMLCAACRLHQLLHRKGRRSIVATPAAEPSATLHCAESCMLRALCCVLQV